MKLFKQLLVAPAALGLLAPLAANASDLNQLEGVEAGIGAVEAGVFSTTTKLNGSTKFVVGGADEALKAMLSISITTPSFPWTPASTEEIY